MRSTFLLALGLSCAYVSTVVDARPRSYSLREECTRDRCVYYQGSKRVGSVEREYGTKRLIVRDGKRRPVAKIGREDNGSLRVEETDREW